MVRKRITIADFFNPELPFVTEFRRLLRKVKNAETGYEPSRSDPAKGGPTKWPVGLKSLLFTSAMLSEGKSTVCSFLALTAARHTRIKTLLIDCDLRRPAIHKFFAMERAPGLSGILARGLCAEDCIRKTSIETLDVITAGEAIPHPAEVLDVDAIDRLVEEMKFYYDLILVDTAPLLPVSDPMLLAPKMDGIILVVKAGATQREVVSRAMDIIDASRHKVIGVVLNNMNNSLPYYYDYSYYGYDYNQQSQKKRSLSGKMTGRTKRNRGKTTEGKPATDSLVRPS
jgi:capsular exopolysaccharide synthesis family protein